MLDPLPDRIETGTTYTVGIWLLQHGFHPYEGDNLGAVGLRLVDAGGKTSGFPGVALSEPGHYAAAMAIPRAGRFTVVAQQGFFQSYRVGTLTVPGALDVLPVPVELSQEHLDKYQDPEIPSSRNAPP